MLPVRATAVSCPGPACSAGPLISWLPGEPLRGDYMLAGCYNPALRHRPLLKHWYSISELLQLRSSPCTPPGHIISSTIKELGLLRRPRYVHRGSRRTFVYSGSENSISSLWANRHPPKTRRHQHYNHTVRTVYLTPLPRAPQPGCHQQKLISSDICTSKHPFT